jgi:serine/threonine protein kinase
METQNKNQSVKYTKVQFNPNDVVLNKYQIISRLGSGGMSSVVYQALDTTIKEKDLINSKEKYVAIKVVNRDET